jgi:hypothetical protein
MKKATIALVIAISIAGNGFFVFQYLRNHPPPSFYYRLYIRNETSEPFLRVSLIQLTDVLTRVPVPPAAWGVVGKGQKAALEIPGDGDEPSTMFCMVALGCDRKGFQANIPADRIIHKTLPFSAFRDNTFTETTGEKVHTTTLCLKDDDMQPLKTLQVWDPAKDRCD